VLKILVKGDEFYDSESEEFLYPDAFELELEHSLVALSKWESKWKKPYLGIKEMTGPEALGYVEAMTLTPNPPEGFLQKLSQDNINQISEYINDSMTATWFRDDAASPNRQIITAELIYYWLFSANIPIEAENWHLNRLFTLIRVYSAKNDSKPKKVNQAQALRDRNRLNTERKKAEGITN
jgi:hypothetical protein